MHSSAPVPLCAEAGFAKSTGPVAAEQARSPRGLSRRRRSASRWAIVGWLGLLTLFAASGSAGANDAFLAYLRGPVPALVAFNPSRYDPASNVAMDPAEIAADLAALRPAFDGLVLYRWEARVTPAVVEQAAAQGYRALLLGVWDPRSPAEIDGVAALLRRWRGRMAMAVCIGNEGINDDRYRIEDLAAARERLRALAGPEAMVPVTTSEPSADYGWAPLRAFGDFLAPNAHPAIDRPGMPPDQAVAWVRDRALAIARFSGRPVLVKETGLPNGGAGIHTPERQRQFWAAWLAPGRLLPSDGGAGFVSLAAAFEAFDAPWKAVQLRDPVEGHWGLMTVDRRPYPAFAVWAESPPRR